MPLSNLPKKSEMGMGTLIIFIAMILVAAIAASVLISTTGSLQNKALTTGKMTTQEIGTSLAAVELLAEDGTDQHLDYWFLTIKLAAGSDPVRFSDTLVYYNLNNQSKSYKYVGFYTHLNGSNATINVTLNCQTLGWGRNISSNWCYQNNTNTECLFDGNGSSSAVIAHGSNIYSVGYSINGTSHRDGYLTTGDIAQVCFKSPRKVTEGERFKISIIPVMGSVLTVETITPSLMINKRISIYP